MQITGKRLDSTTDIFTMRATGTRYALTHSARGHHLYCEGRYRGTCQTRREAIEYMGQLAR